MKKEFVAIFIAFLLASCGGSAQTRRRIAKNHYKQAATEMRIFYEKNDIHALRKSLNEIDKAFCNEDNIGETIELIARVVNDD